MAGPMMTWGAVNAVPEPKILECSVAGSSMSQSGSGNIEDVKSADEEEEVEEIQEEGIVEGAKDEIVEGVKHVNDGVRSSKHDKASQSITKTTPRLQRNG